MDFDPTPCKKSGVRLLEVVPPSRGVRVAGEVRSNMLVDSPGPRPDEDDGMEQSLFEHADDQPQHADDSTTVVSDCLVRWCHITNDRLSVLLQHHCDARGGSVMHLDTLQHARVFTLLCMRSTSSTAARGCMKC